MDKALYWRGKNLSFAQLAYTPFYYIIDVNACFETVKQFQRGKLIIPLDISTKCSNSHITQYS